MDNDKWATRMLVHTEKGQQVLDATQDELIVESFPVDLIVEGASEMENP